MKIVRYGQARGSVGAQHTWSRLASTCVKSGCLSWALIFLGGFQAHPVPSPHTAWSVPRTSWRLPLASHGPHSTDACPLDMRSRARRRCPAQPQAWTRPWEEMAVPAAGSPVAVTQRQALAHL